MPVEKRKLTFDADIKSAILKKIVSEIALGPSGNVSLYYKDPTGGQYGKGDFIKSDPQRSYDTMITMGNKERTLSDLAKVTEKIKLDATKIRGNIR